MTNLPKKVKPSIVVFENEVDRQLKKAVEAVHMSGKLTLPQKKIFNYLIAYAYDELGKEGVHQHQASVQRLIKDTEFDSKNLQALRASLNAIQKTLVCLDLLNDEKGNAGFNDFSLLSEVKAANGIITYSFPYTLRKLLSDPTVYAIINLQLQNKFTSGYSWNLYETVLRFRRVKSTGFIDLLTLRKLMGAEKPTYDAFKLFNHVVLKPSIKEINEKGELFITAEEKKLGRSVVAIKFLIQEKSSLPTFLTSKSEDGNSKSELTARIVALGISEKEANIIIGGQYSPQYISENLTIVEEKIKAGKVKYPSAYPVLFKKALTEDWRVVTSTLEIQLAEDKRIAEEKAAQEKQKLLEAEKITKEAVKLDSMIQKERFSNARTRYNAADEKQKMNIEIAFAAYISSASGFSIVYDNYQKTGLDGSRIVSKAFERWLADEFDNGNAQA